MYSIFVGNGEHSCSSVYRYGRGQPKKGGRQGMTTLLANQRLIGLRELQQLTGLSGRTLRRYSRDGTLPRPLAFSKRRLLWRMADLERFMQRARAK
jgi:predicted DNA-binding transcriptional regulator AlpA